MSAWRYMDAAGRRSIVAARASAGRSAAEIAREFGVGEGEIIRIAGRNDIAFQNAQRPSNRDASAGDEPSPEAGPQAEASHAGIGSGTPADREGHSREGAERRPEPASGAGPDTPPPCAATATPPLPAAPEPAPPPSPSGGEGLNGAVPAEAVPIALEIAVTADDLGRLMAIAGAAGRSAAEIAASIVSSVLADDAAAHGEVAA